MGSPTSALAAKLPQHQSSPASASPAPTSSAVTWPPSLTKRATQLPPSSALSQRATTPTPTIAEATASAAASTTSTALATESHLSTNSAQKAPYTALAAVASTRLWPRELVLPAAAANTPLWCSTPPTVMAVASD